MNNLEIGKQIREKRIEKNLTQDELARLVGFKCKTSISKIELGRGIPNEKCVAFAKVLDISIWYLLGVADEPGSFGENMFDFQGFDEEEVKDFNIRFSSLPAKEQRRVFCKMQGLVAHT